MSIQQEWKCFESITPGVGPLYAPLEVAITKDFLQALLEGWKNEVIDYLWQRTAWGVNRSGTGIPDPILTVTSNFNMSKQWCKVLMDYHLNGEALDLSSHTTQVKERNEEGQ